MGITAFLCVGIGVFPEPLYGILPYPVEFEPYTASHVVTQLQLLVFALLAFAFLAKRHWETPELPCTNVDTDVVYRKLIPSLIRGFNGIAGPARDAFIAGGKRAAAQCVAYAHSHHGPAGVFGRTWLTSSAVLVIVALLSVYLLFAYRSGL